jgi:hypothetical protein
LSSKYSVRGFDAACPAILTLLAAAAAKAVVKDRGDDDDVLLLLLVVVVVGGITLPWGTTRTKLLLSTWTWT